MLLWETLMEGKEANVSKHSNGVKRATRAPRLPYDTQCAALTRSGKRCRCRIRKGSDFCLFHDPEMSAELRRRRAAKGGHNKRKLSHIPGGYLRKLTDQRAVGQAMDRLYREVRLGLVTPEMGKVLFDILTRIMDSGLCDQSNGAKPFSTRTKASRLRPKVSEMLTRVEKAAWRKAVKNTPEDFFSTLSQNQPTEAVQEQNHQIAEPEHQPEWTDLAKPRHKLKLQAVS